jgi:hypothetical protein
MKPEGFSDRRDLDEKRLDAGTWGVFFLWLGISFLAHVPWGVWLLGVGVIILGAQLARRMFALRLDGFWLVAGVLFVLGGVSEVAPFGVDIAIIPVLCIAAGIGLLAKAFSRHAGPRHA